MFWNILVAASSDEGNYKDDRMHGFGRYLSSDGDCCEFLFIFFAWSFCSYFPYFFIASVDEGYYEADKMNGHGRFTYSDGAV